jgi:hypothetical protein
VWKSELYLHQVGIIRVRMKQFLNYLINMPRLRGSLPDPAIRLVQISKLWRNPTRRLYTRRS